MSKSIKFHRMSNILILMNILFLFCNAAQPANNEEVFEKNNFSPILFNFIKNYESNTSKRIILSEQDVIFYKKVFEFQKLGKWKEAENILNQIDNKILMGHVKYQKLMHPTKYRSSFEDLKSWLDNYSDHPMADRIWKLSNKRKPASTSTLERPSILPRLPGYGKDIKNKDYCGFKKEVKKYKTIYSTINDLIRRGRPTQAINFLSSQKNIEEHIRDDLRGRISVGYFSVGKDKKSFQLISDAAKRSGEGNPILYWRKGLAAYRLGLVDLALESFLKSSYINAENFCRSASAYWAAKILLNKGEKKKAIELYKTAALNRLSFYGQLASEDLGLKDKLDWKLLKTEKIVDQNIIENVHFHRAVALSQVRRFGEADQEFRFLAGSVGLDKAFHLVELAHYLKLPAVQLRLGDKLEEQTSKNYNLALYPDPQWVSENSLKVDRALLWAIIRNESAFYLKAKSYRGARGLMQIMPSTARIITGDRTIRGINSWKLYDLDLNIGTGQDLLLRLLQSDNIKDSLIKLLTAWNAGPSRLDRWNKKISIFNDPLLYIESIPSRETRLFVKKVLTDLWIYRDRFDQNKTSLKQLANNEWPKYLKMEN